MVSVVTMLITLCGKLELPKGIRHIAIIIRISLIVYLKQVLMLKCKR